MDSLEKLINDVYDNRLDYKENDYITICNLLMENYNKLKGFPLPILDCKGYISTNNHQPVVGDQDYDLDQDNEQSAYLAYGYLGNDGYLDGGY